MFIKGCLPYNIFMGIILLFVICIMVCGTYATIYECTKVEVETYSVGCEVSQMAYAEEQVSRSNSEPVYKMGVRCDEFSHTFNITEEQFAAFKIGDIVEVEVVVYEYRDGTLKNEYNFLGKCDLGA